MISNIWRILVSIFDLNSHARFLQQKPLIDVVFISNMRDQEDRKRFLGKKVPSSGHFDGPRINIDGIQARVRSIDCTAEEMLTTKGRKKAKKQFIDAVQWAVDRDVKVILLAASTKRLFGRGGEKLRKLFPDIVFTIGDNGTSLVLHNDVFNFLKKIKLNKVDNKILVIGPYGILGEAVTRSLVNFGYNVIGMGTNKAGLKKVSEDYKIVTHESFSKISDINLVVACTHSQDAKLTADIVYQIKRENQKLYVIDVAEPSNITKEEYMKCRNTVIRQDAGNAYSKRLNYVLGFFSYSLFRLSKGVVFGCFAESIALFHAIRNEESNMVNELNLFHVNDKAMDFITEQFLDLGFISPEPRNYGKRVKELGK